VKHAHGVQVRLRSIDDRLHGFRRRRWFIFPKRGIKKDDARRVGLRKILGAASIEHENNPQSGAQGAQKKERHAR
jgi:hypothetical protein